MVFGFFGFCAALQLLGIFLVRYVPASHQEHCLAAGTEFVLFFCHRALKIKMGLLYLHIYMKILTRLVSQKSDSSDIIWGYQIYGGIRRFLR